jgi:Tol biopolymer transport system component/tRNA A-37 threonylcarbamoyl transferase component Bud32
MGEVYKAVDSRVGRQVALKILPESVARDEERRRRFEQEARLAAALNHPNIMAIYDVGLDQHPPYIVSELIPGESLRALISRGPIPARRAAGIAAQMADGVAAAHAAGIVHRDLKPENVMLTPEGVVKILDFGVARVGSKAAAAGATMTMAQTAAGSVVGTAAYMSPEQARAQEVDYRSDQFSLGLVLHEMLSGKQTFERPSAVQTMSAIVEDDAPPIDRPIPAQLRWILERCLAKEPQGRYESTRDLARDLVQLRDRFGDLTSSGSGERAAAPAPIRKFPAVSVAAAVVLAAVLGWCAAALVRDPAAVDMSRYRLTPFATALTTQFYPAWSPDGKSIAFFGAGESGPTQLLVQGVDAATAVPLTGADVHLKTGNRPFWSPDSRSIYFRCSAPSDPWSLCRVPAVGGASVTLQPDVQAATISPDGKTLAMWPTSEHPGDMSVWLATPPEAPRKKYEPMPIHPIQTYNNPTIAFAPDGKQILLSVAQAGKGETSWILPWPPGTGRPIFENGSSDFSFTPQSSWMPDSRHLLFAETMPAGTRQLYMEDTRSDRFWLVLPTERHAGAPSVSPDGTRAAYASDLSQADVIAVPLGEGPVQTLLGSSRNEQRVDASPVSQQLVYVTDRRGVNEVWIKSLAEGWERPLLTPTDVQPDGGPAQDFLNPVFSPDGRRVAVAVKGRNGIYLYTMFTSGGTPVRATSAPAVLELCATWSPDGNWLAYYGLDKTDGKLLKVRPGAGEPPVAVGAFYGSAVPVWSPTAEWIAVHDYNDHLALVSPDGKTVRHLPGDWGPVAWSHDGKTLYQVRGETPALAAIDISSGKDRKLRDLPGLEPFSIGNPGLSAALTSDQKNIVYSVNRPRTEIWILDGLQVPAPWYRRIFAWK